MVPGKDAFFNGRSVSLISDETAVDLGETVRITMRMSLTTTAEVELCGLSSLVVVAQDDSLVIGNKKLPLSL